MKISGSSTPLFDQNKNALVVFYQGTENLLPAGYTAARKELNALLKQTAFEGEAGQISIVQLNGKQVIASGLGQSEHYHNGLLEQAAAAAVRAGCAAGFKTYAMAADIRLKSLSQSDYLLLAGRGAAWGTYDFSSFKTEAKKKKASSLVFAGKISNRTLLSTAEVQGSAMLNTADLANLPGNQAPPEKIASWAKTMAKANELSCQVLGKSELTKKGCGGILSVAQGSARDARMIILKHNCTGTKAKPVVLVGKTVTFDSGGISLKPGKGMGWMRYDKCGGMAVLAAMQMIARMKVKIPVVGILGAAENMPGSRATRPGDIIKAYKGKTIEVLNTDAEGRLVLADALGLAADLKPRAIVDLATLTGACIVALGSSAAAILGNDDKLIHSLIGSGKQSGERLWQLPLYKDYADEMKSDFADISNLGKSGVAGTATAASFLQAFVPQDIPWAHLDIAGTAWLESSKPHQAPGATLFGARLLTQWISGLD